MQTDIKQQLHNLIDNCDNEILLTEAKELLESKENDWGISWMKQIKRYLSIRKPNMKRVIIQVTKN